MLCTHVAISIKEFQKLSSQGISKSKFILYYRVLLISRVLADIVHFFPISFILNPVSSLHSSIICHLFKHSSHPTPQYTLHCILGQSDIPTKYQFENGSLEADDRFKCKYQFTFQMMQMLPRDQEIRSITPTGYRPTVVINSWKQSCYQYKVETLILEALLFPVRDLR